MTENNLIRALKEGRQLSPSGKMQIARYFIEEVLKEGWLSENFRNSLARIQYELWLHCTCGEIEDGCESVDK